MIQVGDSEEWHELDDVNSPEAFTDIVDRFHVGDRCIRGFVVELREVCDGCEKMIKMGGLEVINDGVDVIGFLGVVREDHVDVFAWNDDGFNSD